MFQANRVAATLLADNRYVSQPRSDRPDRVFALRHIPRAVAVICTYADPADPMAVSMTRFDKMREKAGWGNCPTAKALCTRTQKTWAELKRHAIDGDLDLSRSAGAKGYTSPAFTVQEIPYALRLVHGILATAMQVDPKSYVMKRDDYGAQVIVLGARRGRSRMHLPNVNYVESLTGLAFTEACEQAGLPVAEKAPPAAPAQMWQVAEFFLEAYGCLPSSHAARTFAEVNAIGAEGYKRGWQLDLAELRSRRDARGLWTPPRALPADQRPDPIEPTGIDYGFPRRQWRSRLGDQEVLDEACAFLRWVDGPDSPPGARPTKNMWRMWANEDPSRLSINGPAMAEGGFAATIARASDLLLPEHLREAQAETDWQAGHERLRAIVLDGADPDLVAILTLVDQHGPLTRMQLAGAMDMSLARTQKRVERLIGMGGLRSVDPLPDDRWTTADRVAIGTAVVGAVAGALRAMDPLPAPPDAGSRDRGLTALQAQTLEACRRVADPDGWVAQTDLQADMGVSRELSYDRLRQLVRRGLLERVPIPRAEQVTNGPQNRWRLANAESGEQEAA